MAITTVIPTLKVTVHANGAPLQEHQDEELAPDNETTVRYIEATTGETFCIRVDIGAGTEFIGDSLAFHIAVDGKLVDSTITRRTGQPHVGSQVSSQGRYLTGGRLQKYQFANLDTSEGRMPTAEEVEEAKQLGTIRVEVHHQIRMDSGAQIASIATAQGVGAVSERALKGQSLSHSVGFGEAERYQGIDTTYWNAEYVDPNMEPASVYIFRYRSRETLVNMGIIEDETPDEEYEPKLEPGLPRGTPIDLQNDTQSSQGSQGDASDGQPIKREFEEAERRGMRKKARMEKVSIVLDDAGDVASVTVEERVQPEPEHQVDLSD